MAFTVVLLRRDGARMWIRSFLIDGEHYGGPETACGRQGRALLHPNTPKADVLGTPASRLFFHGGVSVTSEKGRWRGDCCRDSALVNFEQS
jgi:hypothetical protein